MTQSSKKLLNRSLGIMGILLFTAGIFFMAVPRTEGAPPVSKPLMFFYPAKSFEGGKAKFFEYKTEDGVVIKYFILKSSDGVIRAAFDACDVCWREGKGYVQNGDFMVCRNCGRRFASVRVNEVTGGCNPAALTREIKEGNVVIKTADLLEGKRYFSLSRKG